ncbi:MAG: hypothetical protein GX060_03965 [Firmicutes bacterium]|nr:hypothetical protein [Bacillota bacterium]
MDLTAISQRAETFLQSFYKILYQYHKQSEANGSLEQAYAAAGIFEPEIVDELREAMLTAAHTGPLRRLFRFVASGVLRRHLLPLEKSLAEHYDQLSWPHSWAKHDTLGPGQPLPEQPQGEQLETLAAIYSERWRQLIEKLADLGFKNPVAFYEYATGIDPITLVQAAESYLDQNQRTYLLALATLAKEHYPFADRWQLEHFLRGEAYDAHFPAAELLPAMEDTLYHLGVDVTRQPNLVLEVNRDLPSGLAFAFPVRVPQEIYVCVSPMAGIVAYEQLLGLMGMVMPRLLVDPQLDWLARRLPDPALDSACAELFISLLASPEWRADRLGAAAASDELQDFINLRRLYRMRLRAARAIITVDRSLGQADYSVTFQQALGAQHDLSARIIDMGYLRNALDAWRGIQVGARFAAQLAERYGRAWYRQPECGEFLRQLFNRGLTSLEDLKLP